MNHVAEDILKHYGMPKRSGRYPYGSGKEPFQRSGDFLSRVTELKNKGFSEKQIAEDLGLSTTQLRIQKSLAKNERKALEVDTAMGLRKKGYNLQEIADKMGYKNESSVRNLLDSEANAKKTLSENTVNFLKKQIDEKGMIDVGAGVEKELNVSREKLNEALYVMELEGYSVLKGGIPQVTNKGKQTNTIVLAPPGTEKKAFYDFDKVHSIRDYISYDGGDTFKKGFVYPKSMDSKRIKVRYDEEGGSDKDGLIELRRNVDDISLGTSTYSQVRILVDDKKYMKGMAVYSDNMPDGIDVVFNTNKKKGTPKEDVFKNIKDDPSNPFGSLIKEHGGQSYYIDKNGKEQLSLINKRSDEGDWQHWSNTLSSQFLSKQNKSLIQKQLKLTEYDKESELKDIQSLTNPTVKKKMLNSYADDCDSAAVHLKAASLPRQKYHVILPVTSVKDTEVYAPNYKDGEQVALVRYPHGGTFEIPILTVNNKSRNARQMMGSNPIDAIGINKKVADRMSGADFDGDTVMVIPTNSKTKITSTPPLKGLEGFDPKLTYGADKIVNSKTGDKYYRGDVEFKPMRNTQNEMGRISNLITDMTLKGANQDELSRAVKHSMVVIDAEKHNLDYKQSYNDNAIASLKKKYQGRTEDGVYKEGSATLISKASSPIRVDATQGSPKVNLKGTDHYDPNVPEGSLLYKTSDNLKYITSDGTQKSRTKSSTPMAETHDAFSLSSGTVPETLYASYANKMKSLANTARKDAATTGKIAYSPEAKKQYESEVKSLNTKLDLALKNAPREREAQRLANTIVDAKIKANPDMTNAEIKKASQQAIVDSRLKVGAERSPVDITTKEWEAIQKGAISENKLTQILNHTDLDKVRSLATPRQTSSLSSNQIAKINSLKAKGYTNADIAQTLGVSTNTVTKYL